MSRGDGRQMSTLPPLKSARWPPMDGSHEGIGQQSSQKKESNKLYDEPVGVIFAPVRSVNPQLEPSLRSPGFQTFPGGVPLLHAAASEPSEFRSVGGTRQDLTALSHPSTTTDYPFTQGGGCLGLLLPLRLPQGRRNMESGSKRERQI